MRSRWSRDSPTNKKPPDAAGGRGLAWSLARTLEEALELSASHRMLEFSDGFGLDLSDPFSRDLEDAAHLLEGVGIAVTQPVAELDDLALAVGERLQDLSRFSP